MSQRGRDGWCCWEWYDIIIGTGGCHLLIWGVSECKCNKIPAECQVRVISYQCMTAGRDDYHQGLLTTIEEASFELLTVGESSFKKCCAVIIWLLSLDCKIYDCQTWLWYTTRFDTRHITNISSHGQCWGRCLHAKAKPGFNCSHAGFCAAQETFSFINTSAPPKGVAHLVRHTPFTPRLHTFLRLISRDICHNRIIKRLLPTALSVSSVNTSFLVTMDTPHYTSEDPFIKSNDIHAAGLVPFPNRQILFSK